MLNPEKDLKKTRIDDILKRLKRLEVDLAEIATGEAFAGRTLTGLSFLEIINTIQIAEVKFVLATEERKGQLDASKAAK